MECLVICITFRTCNAVCEFKLNLTACSWWILVTAGLVALNDVSVSPCRVGSSFLFLVYLASLSTNHMPAIGPLLHLGGRRPLLCAYSVFVICSTCWFTRLLDSKSDLFRILALLHISEALIVIWWTIALIVFKIWYVLLYRPRLRANWVNCRGISRILNCWRCSNCAFFLLNFSFWSTSVRRKPPCWE